MTLFRVVKRAVQLAIAVPLVASIVAGQGAPQDQTQNTEDERILGIIPNYRTSSTLSNHKPLTATEKFKIASQDAFDGGTFILAGIFAGEAQLTNDNRAFGQGGAGFVRYYGAAYGDLLIGDYMTEAVFPTLLRQDPRYFRRGAGSTRSRLAYAIGQIFWTHRDSGERNSATQRCLAILPRLPFQPPTTGIIATGAMLSRRSARSSVRIWH